MRKAFKSIINILGLLVIVIAGLVAIFYIFPAGTSRAILGALISLTIIYIYRKQSIQDQKIEEEKRDPSLGNIETKKYESENKGVAWIVLIGTFFICMMAFTSSISTNGVFESLIFVNIALSFLLYILLSLIFPFYDLHIITNKKGLPKFFVLIGLALVLEVPLFGVFILTSNPWWGVMALVVVGLGGFLWVHTTRKRALRIPFVNPLIGARRRLLR